MKKLISLSNKPYFPVWCIFHAAVLLVFLCVFFLFQGKKGFDADLFNMIPKSFEDASVRAANDKLTKSSSQNAIILVSHSDFDAAKKAAEEVYRCLSTSGNFDDVSLYTDGNNVAEITDFMHRYRWNLLDEETSEKILSAGTDGNGIVEQFASEALERAFSPFSVFSVDAIETDPFMLSQLHFERYVSLLQKSGMALSVKDGVLASSHEGRWYIMLRGLLSKKGAALANSRNGVAEIHSVCSQLEKDGVRFVFSGTPFHSYESSTQASREITIITTAAMLLVVLLLLYIFRSPKPILASVFSIGVSVCTGLCATLAVFKTMHVMTLVFGTSLIGSCIDYSLHFFTHWAANSGAASGADIRKRLMKPLSMAIVSTTICFAMLLFAPFTLIRQIAVFCTVGLFSSFLTTVCLFPSLALPEGPRQIPLVRFFEKKNPQKAPLLKKWNTQKKASLIILLMLFVCSVCFIACFRGNLKIENNLAKLYKMKGRLLADEIEAASVIQYSPAGWFIISGKSEEELLQHEEILCNALRSQAGFGRLLAASQFVPSAATQKKSQQACVLLLQHAEEQFLMLGFDEAETQSLVSSLQSDLEAAAGKFISIENGTVPPFVLSAFSSVWIGESDGTFYSAVMPNSTSDKALFEKISAQYEFVHWINTVSDISSDLDRLTRIMIWFFAVSFVLVFVILNFLYPLRDSLQIISIPLLIVLVTGAVFSCFNIAFEFFSVTGIVLVFGLGLDYIIYTVSGSRSDTEDNALERTAVFLSFVTTVLSFGVLAAFGFAGVTRVIDYVLPDKAQVTAQITSETKTEDS
ncbi:MAG: MMPL family transporter, partial [Spirochaetaceae bacterium]|nr:MMPL family transporter [Spirochaetaceae bacterium]